MRVTGTVKWFDLARGFGVIGREQGEADCLVRHSAMRGTMCNALAAGEPVEFDVVQGGTGAVARDVIRLGRSLVRATIEREGSDGQGRSATDRRRGGRRAAQ